jgi:hypothetical protein
MTVWLKVWLMLAEQEEAFKKSELDTKSPLEVHFVDL